MATATSTIVAIDILLEPDARMLKRAEANNARLLKAFPDGFALDSAHRPHITLLQCFVPAEDLDNVYAAVGRVIASADVPSMNLEGFKYYYLPAPGGTGVAGICARATPALLKLQAEVIAAATPFTVKTATIDAFTAPHGNPAMDTAMIGYVAEFVPKASGEHFNPHVSTGAGSYEYLDKMLAEPFEPFAFSPAGAAVYQLGPFGTAAKKLQSFDLNKSSDHEQNNPAAVVLPSWNDGPARQSILDFVHRVTTIGSRDFVPVHDRIAVFDNDGTLWAESPVPVQLAFVIDRMPELAPEHPEWKEKQPFKAILENDLKTAAAAGMAGLVELVMATHAGMTTEEFEEIVREWIATARHPRFKRPYTELAYQPMLELLAYLRAHEFKTFIVSGGGVEFMRTFSEAIYGIPPEQVVGSSIVTKYEVHDGKPVLVRQATVNFFDDKESKPVGVNTCIGRRPIAAFGNSDGDFAMLEWVAGGSGARFALIVHHDDAVREFAYDRAAGLAKLARGLDEGPARGWTLVSIKKDWKRVFPFDSGAEQ